MEQAELGRAREKLEAEVRRRFEGAAFEKIELLQYGDDPEIEPGGLLVRVTVAMPEGSDSAKRKDRERALDSFHDRYREVIHEFGDELRGRAGLATLEFGLAGEAADEDGPGKRHGPHIKLKMGRGPGPFGGGDQPLTPVMARVGPEELETLDTLIAVGIAGSRSEAVRWALARIRERPAYEQIRARSREIEELKAQF
jgi:hypothetical protein